ncbi:MAG: YdjY domain-containing protein [Verrucomicrobiota bacterium]
MRACFEYIIFYRRGSAGASPWQDHLGRARLLPSHLTEGAQKIGFPKRALRLRVLIALWLGALGAGAQEAPAAGGNSNSSTGGAGPNPASIAALSNSPVQMLGPDIFQVGKVILDKKERAVRVPALLNKSQGPMEYFLVTTYGKTHESILKTDAEPYHIHIAMLLLGATGAQPDLTNGPPPAPGPIVNPSPEALPGDKITLEVSWQEDGKEIRRPASELISNEQTHSTPDAAHWVYNGSETAGGKFYAQMDGSLISLVTDPVALVNYTGIGHDNDQIWVPNTNRLPPRTAPLEVILKLAPKATP